MIYSVTEFRKNIREILDAVDHGAEVQIQRYDKLYSINPAPTGTFVVAPEARKAIDLADSDSTILENGKVVKKIVVQAQKKKVTPKQQKLDAAVAAETNLCEHAQVKGRCMVKGCKYGSKS